MTAARKHLSHGLLLLLLAPVLLRRQGRNRAETCGLRPPYRRLQDTGRESRGDAPGKRHRTRHTQPQPQPRQSLFDMRRTALRLAGSTAETATGHGQNGCVPFFMPRRRQKRRQNKKLLLFLQENPKQTVTKSYGVQFQGDRAQVAAPLAGK